MTLPSGLFSCYIYMLYLYVISICDDTTLGFPHSYGVGPTSRRLSLSRPDGVSVGLLSVVLPLTRGRKRPSLYILHNDIRRYIKYSL